MPTFPAANRIRKDFVARDVQVGSLILGTESRQEPGPITLDVDAAGQLTVDGAYTTNHALVSFTETTGAGTYTGSVAVPAGSLITDIKVWSTALWTAATSATMKVGDATDDDGYFVGVNLKATDLLVGEELNFVQVGGKNGAYLDTSTGKRSAVYNAAAVTISGIVVTVGASGSAGRTFMLVSWVTPTASAAAKA